MKRCPECRRDYYDDTLLYCLDDGSALLEGPASMDEPVTAVLHDTSQPNEAPTRQQITSTKDSATGTTRSHTLQNTAIGIVVLGIVIAAGVLGIRYLRSPAPQPQRTSENLKTQRLTGDGKTRGAEISPDGKFLAYVRGEGAERSVWIKQIQTNTNLQILKAGELDRFDGFVFSPDGNFLYFDADNNNDDVPSVYRMPSLGGTPTRVLTNANNVQFSPDGKQVSFVRYDFAANESSVYVASADGSNERKIGSRIGNLYFDKDAPWSPDGTMVAVLAGDDTSTPNPPEAIALLSVSGGSESFLGTTRWYEINDLVWHPSADSVIVVARDSQISQPQIWEVAYPSGTPRRLTNNLNGHGSVSITADGKSIVTGEIYSRTAVWVSPDLKPENAKQVMPATADTWGLSWTPDDRIVYVSDMTGDAEVWIMDADGANAKPLTNDRVFKTTPVVSPDGRYIVYTSNSGSGQLYRIDINGADPKVLVTSPGADNPDISLDGKWVIYSTFIGGLLRVMRVSIEGGEPQSLTEYRGQEPRYSRDGTRFACFIPNEKTQDWNRLAIVPAEGGPPIKVFDVPRNVNVGRGPIWTPDDSGITLIVSQGELQNLWLQPVAGGDGKPMTNFPLPGVARREYSRDGKRIAIVRGEGHGNAIMITDFR